jgi:uncharacterized membrane protein
VNSFSSNGFIYKLSSKNAVNSITHSGMKSKGLKRDILKAVWKDSVVSLSIPASKEKTYQLFSSLNEHPTWSNWLQNVEFDRETRLSKWTLKSLGLEISWNAINTIMDCPNMVQWESLDGFPNKGRVQFSDDCDLVVEGVDEFGYEIYEEVDECSITPESTLLTLTISYDLPQAGYLLLCCSVIFVSFIIFMLTLLCLLLVCIFV